MRRTNPYAVASLVCALLWVCGLGSLLAIVFGHLARRQIGRRDEKGRVPALLGLVLGYSELFLMLLLLLLQGGLWVAPGR